MRFTSLWRRAGRQPLRRVSTADARRLRLVLEQLEDRTLLATGLLSGLETLAAPVIPVALSTAAAKTVIVNYKVISDGTAVAGKDFNLPGTMLKFLPGETVHDLPLAILTNHHSGGDLTVHVQLSAGAGVALAKTDLIYTILDTDSPPTVAFSQAAYSAAETTSAASLQLVLSGQSELPVTVPFTVTGGTATGADYKLTSGVVTIKPGQISVPFSFPLSDDHLYELNETVQLTLGSPSHAKLGTQASATLTITESDPVPKVGFTKTTAGGPESTPGTGLVVNLSAPSGQVVTVGYAVTAGSALSGFDYTLTGNTLTFAPGTTSLPLPLTIVDNGQAGGPKTVTVTLAPNPANATLGTSTVTYTIAENDPNVAFVKASDSAPDTAGTVSLPVQLSEFHATPVTVNYTVSGGTAKSGVDYRLASGMLHFPAFATTPQNNIQLTLLPDLLTAGDKTVQVTLSAPSKGIGLGVATETFTIHGQSAAVNFSQAASTVALSGHTARLTVTLSAPYRQTVTVPFAFTSDSTALAGVDYTLPASTTLSFPAGTKSQTLTIALLNDHVNRPDRTLTLALLAPSAGAALGTVTTATVTIHNDNAVPNASFAQGSVSASAALSEPTIPVTLSVVSGKTIAVNYAATGGTAQNGVDYRLFAGTLFFAPGVKTLNLPLAVIGGSTAAGKTIQITLTGATNATLGATKVLNYTLSGSSPQLGFDTTGPAILVNATYTTPTGHDTITVNGTVVDDASGVASLTLDINGTATPLTVSATGSFSFTVPLTNGGAAIHLHATDKLSNPSNSSDTEVPILDLALLSDDGTIGDRSTTATTVTLVGHAPPGTLVTLAGTGRTATADGEGVFQFLQMPLALGANPFTAQVSDAGGGTANFNVTITRTPATGSGTNPVLVWNQATLNAIQIDGTDPLFASRGLAMVQSAVFDAINSIQGTPAYYVKVAAAAGASIEAAVDAAAHNVLVYLYPAQRATFDTLLTTQLALLPANQARGDGVTAGQAEAAAIIALRANDGAHNFVAFEPSSTLGSWQPTAPAYALATNPQFANVTPFALTSPSQFTPAGPPALTSPQWADAVNQTESIGAVHSTARTADQTQTAQFWNDATGTATPPGHWNAIADGVAQSAGMTLGQTAAVLAALDIALADAGITAWNAKFDYNAWRPITVIQTGGSGVNPAVHADPTWYPLLTTPSFPEYVSGHSTFSGAAATVLDSFFGPNVSFTSTEPTLPGVVRSFTSFDQAATEAGMSRIYAGIHFIFSDTDGLAAGASVGNFVLNTFKTIGTDTTPPRVALDNVLPGGATKTNVTVTGVVTDNYSGVAKLEARVDGGSFATVSFNAQTGKFSFPTTFALNGSADGAHTIAFRATDAAGNVSGLTTFSLTLGTQPPAVTVTSPANNATLTGGATLAGTAPTSGPALVALSYNVDGGASFTLTFSGTTNAFSQTLDLAKLTTGSHTLAVTATDAAGNTTTSTINVSLPAPVHLAITSQTPAAGASDVSVTFRPRVLFARPIDKATLSAADFFVSDSQGNRLAAAIVTADDNLSAQLFVTNPLPGASTITLTVDGSTIKAADGTLLDAAGNGTAGSKLTTTFSTVSTATVAGTTLSGIVADPGDDLQAMTRDDVRNGPDGVLGTADDIYLHVIAGAKAFIIGHEDQAVTSDAQGRFSFPALPVGHVKLVVDGRTATNAPTGVFYPEMVFDLTIQPGVANTVMGTMGTLQEQQAMGGALGVYLPRIQSTILKTVTGNAPTTVTLDPSAAPTLTPEQIAGYSLTVAPNSLVGMDGKKMTSGQVGFSTVPPSLIRDMLPAGVMQLATTLTIQAPGVAAFSTPLQLTFANVYGAAPGSKLDVYSFNHTTGMLEISGTATVSADGKTVTTDADSGVTHPGWFGVTPPGNCGGDGGTPRTPGPKNPPDVKNPVVLPLLFGESGTFPTLPFTSTEKPANPPPPPPPGCPPQQPKDAPYLEVRIDIDGPISEFMKQTGSQPLAPTNTFNVSYGQTETFGASALPYADMFKYFFGLLGGGLKSVNTNVLFGSKITVTQTKHHLDGTSDTTVQPYFLYRFVDATDDNHEDKTISFEDVAILPTPLLPITRTKQIDMRVGSLSTTLSAGDAFAADNSGKVTFTPGSLGASNGTLTVTGPAGAAIGTVALAGKGVSPQVLNLNTASLKTLLTQIGNLPKGDTFGGTINPLHFTETEKQFVKANVDAIVSTTLADVDKLISGSGLSAYLSVKPDAGDVTVNWSTYVGETLYGDSGASGNVELSALRTLFNDHNKYSTAELEFRLAQTLNHSPGGSVTDYVDTPLESPVNQETLPNQLDITNVNAYANALAKTAIHETAHTFGAFHAAVLKKDVPTQNMVQVLTLAAATGANATFQLNFDGEPLAAPLAANAGAADVEAALAGLPNLQANNVSVRGPAGGPYRVTFQGAFAGMDVPTLLATGVNNLPNPSVTIAQHSAVSRSYAVRVGLPGDTQDLMDGFVVATQGDLLFQPGLSKTVLQFALKGAWNDADAQSLLTFYFAGAGKGFDGEGEQDYGPLPGPALQLVQSGVGPVVSTIDLGQVSVDGPGGAMATAQLTLNNPGAAPLHVTQLAVSNGSGFAFAGSGPTLPLTLAPGDSATYTVRFDPVQTGAAGAVLQIASDDPTAPSQIQLTGTGQAPTAALALSAPNNNLGGVAVGSTTSAPSVATITNQGAQPLVINSIQLTAGSSSFALTGVPADLATNPVTVLAGHSFTFGVQYTASKVGLERARIAIASNDPGQPLTSLGVVGTGLAPVVYPHWGNDWIALEFPDLGASATLRTVSDANGHFSFFLPPQQRYHIAVFDPVTGLIAHGHGSTPASGTGVDLSSGLVFGASTAVDTDGDGLPNDVEFAIGTSPTKADTDHSGIDDFTAIQEGLDPLGGRSLPTGIVGALPLPGQVKAIDVEASASGQLAYVATASAGLAVVDVTQPTKPVLVTQLALPGDSQAVAVDVANHIAVVAAGSAGVNLVSIADPTHPTLLKTVALPNPAQNVVIVDGMAYVTDGAVLTSIDDSTGEIIGLQGLGNGTLTGLAREGGIVYTMDSNKVLRAIGVDRGAMTPRGSLTLSDGGGQLFVGNGIAYAAASSNSRGGFDTADVSNPDQLKLLGAAAQTSVAPSTAVVANGSGLALEAGDVLGNSVVNLLNSADATNTTVFLTRITLPASPLGLTLAGGFAYIADGSGGLQVVNYVGFDTLGQPPAVSVTSTATDLDANTAGVQVIAGQPLPLQLKVSDDVQVRSVDLLINGQVAQSGLTFPFALAGVTPNLPPGSTVIVQLRATDTGGNVGLSNVLSFHVVANTFPPTITSVSPADNATVGKSTRRVRINFSEPLAAGTVNAGNFQLFDSSNTQVPLTDVGLRDGGTDVQLSFASLQADTYRVVIKAAQVTDQAGNALGQADIVSHFTINLATIRWINAAGGSWTNPSNWDKGVVPGPTDDVLIDVAGSPTITLNGNVTIDSLVVLRGNLTLSGGTLTLASASQLTGGLTLSGGTLAPQDVLSLSGTMTWSGGTLGGTTGSLLNKGTITVTTSNPSLSGTLTNQGALLFTGTNSQLRISTGAHLTNQATRLIDFQGGDGSGITNDGAGGATPGTLTNYGTIRRSQGSGTLYLSPALLDNQGGTIDVESGNAVFNGYFVNSTAAGSFTVAAGSILDLTGGTLTYTGTFAGSGAGIVRINSSLNIGAAGATFNFSGSLLQWSGGIMGGTGVLTNAGSMTIADGDKRLDGQLTNSGTIIETGSGRLFVSDTGLLTNQAGALLDLQGNDGSGIFTIDFNTSSSGTLTNLGTIRRSTGTGTANLSPKVLNNQGTIDVEAANLLLNGTSVTGTAPGSMTVVAGSILDLTASTVTYTGSFAGSGAGLVRINSNLNVGAAGATFNFPTGLLQWTGGVIGGTGTLTNQGTWTLAGSGERLDGLVNNAGTMLNTAGYTYISDPAVLTNEASGILDFQGSDGTGIFNYNFNTSSRSTVINKGTIRRSQGTGTAVLGPKNFDNQGGSFDVQTATLAIRADFVNSTGGTFNATSPGVLELALNNTSQYTGTFAGSGTGIVRLSSGTLNVGDAGATFNFTNTPWQWTGGVIGGTGTLTNQGTWTLAGSGERLDGLVNNAGTMLNTAGYTYISDPAVLTNEASGILDFQGSDGTGIFNYNFNTSSRSTVINKGTIRRSQGTGTAVLGPKNFDNQGGSFDVQTATLAIRADFVNSTGGTFNATSPGVLELALNNTSQYTGTFAGSGTGIVRLSSGTLNVGDAGATFNFTNTPWQWTGGVIGGTGTLTNQGTWTLAGSGERLDGLVNNTGTMLNTAGYTYISDPAVLTNEASGILDFQGSDGTGIFNYNFNTSSRSTVINKGTIRRSQGTGAAVLGPKNFDNQGGSFDVQTATLAIRADFVNSTGGTFNATSPGVLELALNNTSQYTGTFAGGGTGIVRLSSGTLNVGDAGATFNFTNTPWQWTGGVIGGTGTLTNQGTWTLAGNGERLDGLVNNAGTMLYATGFMYLSDPGVLTNAATGVIDIQGGDGTGIYNYAFNTSSQSTVTNLGTLKRSQGSGIGHIDSKVFNNSGALTVSSATLSIGSGFTNAGAITLGSGGTLTVNGAFGQASGGAVTDQIGGSPASGLFGKLNVTGAATLAGTLTLQLVNSFVPNLNDAYALFAYASETGVFATVNGLTIGGGKAFSLSYNTTNLTATVVPG